MHATSCAYWQFDSNAMVADPATKSEIPYRENWVWFHDYNFKGLIYCLTLSFMNETVHVIGVFNGHPLQSILGR